MKNNLLEVGNVFRLDYGSKVYANLPEGLVYQNLRGSEKLVKSEAIIGTAVKDPYVLIAELIKYES